MGRIFWLEDGAFKNVVEMTLDPVCGMSVDKESAPARAEVDGRTYYFCANGCRDEFLAAPEKFLLIAGQTQEQGAKMAN